MDRQMEKSIYCGIEHRPDTANSEKQHKNKNTEACRRLRPIGMKAEEQSIVAKCKRLTKKSKFE